ncbi:MAG TPA: hypothetical protein VLA89_12310, partial [Gemmatimonadales bacterium]|nr:hypothetical protein [Gemmatimonadales bacterium]
MAAWTNTEVMNTLWFHERPHSHRLLSERYSALQLFDFVIDGEWLEDVIRAKLSWGPEERANHEPPFGWGHPEEQRRAARRLLGREAYSSDPGRPPLLICPLDGDLYCGYTSVRLHLDDETVRWDRLGDSSFDWGLDAKIVTAVERFEGVAFEFGRAQYEAAFADLLARVDARPPWPADDAAP